MNSELEKIWYYPGVYLKGWNCKTLVRVSSLELLHMNMRPCAMMQECFPFHHDIWYKFLMFCCVCGCLEKCEKYSHHLKWDLNEIEINL